MMKRFGLIAIAGALAFAGCDDGDGGDAGPCPMGTICIDSGPPTGDAGVDGGGDAGPPPPCNSVGRSGGLCRMGTQCVTGLTCMGELTAMGMPLTLGNIFNIQDGTLDTGAPYPEYTPTGPSSVRINVTPGGLCSEGCSTDAMTDTCGSCSICNEDIGGSSSFGAVGISIRTFDLNSVIGAGEDGVCRARCNYDGGATNGGCPTGHTCDRFSNTCLESCLNDEMCNLSWGDSKVEGLVAIQLEGAPFTCNTTNGLCEWTGPATAAFGSECDSSADCASGTGLCYFGRCTETSCSDATGMAAGPGSCPMDGAACFNAGGNNASFCLGLCNTAADCAPEHACDPLSSPVMDAMGTSFPGACVGPCENNGQCQMDRRCDATVQRFADETLGICNEFCDPTGGTTMPGAVTCDATLGEICEQVEGQTYGFCKSQNRLCPRNESCNGDQRCRQDSNDGLGRCEDSCTTNADCTALGAGAECVIVDSDTEDMIAETRGVCRAPGGACSPSPISNTTGAAIYPLRGASGDEQCVSTQRCDAPIDPMTGMPMADAVGTCVDR